MARSRPWSDANPDLRRRIHVPSPSIEEIEKLLLSSLNPASFKPLKGEIGNHGKLLRDRLLTLPVMVAIVLSLVCRTIPSLHELCRILAQEGLLWVKPMKISVEALSKRLQVLPYLLFEELLKQVQLNLPSRNRPLSPLGESLVDKFPQVWIADGSTLEELRRNLKIEREESGTILAGKMMAIVDLWTYQPVEIAYTENSQANDKTFCTWLLSMLPVGGLLIFDLGFFSFPWFDKFTQQGKFFVTRWREKTAMRVVKTLSSGEYYRDEIVQLGKYRSHPCLHQLRLVSVFWSGQWYCYLTNVLEPSLMPPHLVCQLYRCRWRIEDAFNLTKRLLGLSYLWVSSRNGVQVQLSATWIFYVILNFLCAEVAFALEQPLERISVEMVFRGLYHFSRAYLQGTTQSVVEFLCERHQLLGLLKQKRKRRRERDAQFYEIWGFPALS